MKNWHDTNPLGDQQHHSIGLHFKGLTICLDIQCSKEDRDLVTQIKKYITTTCNKAGKKDE